MKTLISYTQTYNYLNEPISLQHTVPKHTNAIKELLSLVATKQIPDSEVDYLKIKTTIKAIRAMRTMKDESLATSKPIKDIVYYPNSHVDDFDFMIIKSKS